MRILIVFSRPTFSEEVDYSYNMPLGLMYVSSVVKRAGHDVDVLNLCHRKGKSIDIIREALDSADRYDFVCTGGLSIHYKQVKEVVDCVRAHQSGAGVILGGGLISSEPELMLEALKPDFVVIGEGEDTIVELLSNIENKGNPADVLGVGFRDLNGTIVITPARPAIADLDILPLPDFEGFELTVLLDNLKPSTSFTYDLFDNPRAYPLVSSRSCPFRCTFCYHPIGKKYRQRSLDAIMNELEDAIVRYKINIIMIYDELFSIDRERVYEFCRRFKKIQKKTPWEMAWCCQMRVDRLGDEFLATMKDAGCYMVSLGFESYSPVVLKSMKKHITPEQIDNAIHLTMKNQISIVGNFIFGDKAETVETVRQTIDYWKKIFHSGIKTGFIQAYPGTWLYHDCIKRGIIKDKLDFIENHITDIINMTDSMTEEEFRRLEPELRQLDEDRTRTFLVALPLFPKRNSDGDASFSVKCPHCDATSQYKNYGGLTWTTPTLTTFCKHCRRRFWLASRYHMTSTRIRSIGFLIAYNLLGETGRNLTRPLRRMIRGYCRFQNKKLINGR